MGVFRIYGGINTSNATQIIQSSATTWGTLKQELQDKGIMNSNMSAAIKENQVGLSVDGYTLPTGIGTGRNGERTNDYDFTVVLTASKMKSGGTVNISDVEDSIKQAREEFHEDLNDCSISEIHDKVDEILDNMIDNLNSDGLDIEQSNTYEDSVSTERTATTASKADCPDCDELEAIRASIS